MGIENLINFVWISFGKSTAAVCYQLGTMIKLSTHNSEEIH